MSLWLQLSSGRGPAECQWVVAQVLGKLRAEAAAAGVALEVLEAEPGDQPHTLLSALVSLTGDGAEALATSWVGTVQWIVKSPYRPHHKRQNWFIGVERLAVPERPQWSERELVFSTMRSSGPGGQHVNKTESAVRVTHTPTGLSATAREERSQQQNRKLALARLAAQFEARAGAAEQEQQQARWQQHNTLERGNPVRVFRGS